MPWFQISGRGVLTGRKRRREVRVLDRATALAMMAAEDTLVEECVELPDPQADAKLVAHAEGLGVSFEYQPSRPECIFEILRWCVIHHRVVSITYHTDLDGIPWQPGVEPHGFQRSKEGFRLRCYLPSGDSEPEVVFESQVAGWHLYLIEDIEWAEATEEIFKPRPYRHIDDEVAITMTLRWP